MLTPPTRQPVLVGAPHLRSESESPQQGREMPALALRPIAFDSSTSQGRCSSERLEMCKANTHLDRFDFSIHELVLSGGTFETVLGQVHRIATIVNVREYLHRHTSRKVGPHVIEPCQVSYHFVPATRESFKRWDSGECKAGAHTLCPTCFPVPGSFVESFTTVVPRLYNAFASPIRSCSRSPWIPIGGSDCAESGAGGGT